MPATEAGHEPNRWYADQGGNIHLNGSTLYANESGAAVSATELAKLDDASAILATEAGAGITGGTGTVYESSVMKTGGIITTRIILDLTGLASVATDGDIIGVGSSAAHIGQITAAKNGTIFGGRMVCLETPAGGEVDLNLYAADEGTGVLDGAIGSLVETAIVDRAGDWAANDERAIGAAVPAANQYLYLSVGTASTPTAGTYTAGKFVIELFGYDA